MSKITIDGERFMTPKEYAESKGKAFRTIYNWIDNGKLRTKKILGKTLVMVD